ncbi:MAG: B12-binding domain-containing radical SAM protein [Promethearchaeota archaeon]
MKPKRVLIVSSPTCEDDKTQASLIYLATFFNEAGLEFDLLDLSGNIDYFDPPEDFFSPCDSEYWLSPRIFHDAQWLDAYLPSDYQRYDAVFYSSLFSPDILILGRHALIQKKHYANCSTIIGGAAINCLNDTQLSVLSEVFAHICIGYDIADMIFQIFSKKGSSSSHLCRSYITAKNPPVLRPNYGLLDIRPFITVYSGHGCDWGRCRFCNSQSLSEQGYYSRSPENIAKDFEDISKANGKVRDVMLSSDSFTRNDLVELMSCLRQKGSRVPYNLMLRGDQWISKEIGESLKESGCTDVFIGAESLNNDVLRILNKGISTESIIGAVKCLSNYVKVIVGLLLFIPQVTERQLDKQLINLEKVLPYVHAVEPEILSVIQGTEFAVHNEGYGIKLWTTDRTINDSWCYGLSPDIPWTFDDKKEADMWFSHYDELRTLLGGFVQQHYWDSIDHIRLRF